MRANCKRVLPLAEKVKSELLVKYQSEYEEYTKALKIKAEEEKLEAERKALEMAKVAAAVASTPFQGFASSMQPPPYTVKPTPGRSSIQGVNYDYDGIIDNRTTVSSNEHKTAIETQSYQNVSSQIVYPLEWNKGESGFPAAASTI